MKQQLVRIALRDRHATVAERTSTAAEAASYDVPGSARLKACPDTNPPRHSGSFVPVGDLTTENNELRTQNYVPRTYDGTADSCRPDTRHLRPETFTDGVFVSDIFAHTELLAAPVFEAANQRTRPNLKVQDGCDNRCSFCVIPYVRGQSRSLKLDDVIHEVDGLVASGYREVVISGINLGRWGRDFQAPLRFEDLVSAILERTALEKLRISSVEPMDWSDELIALVAGSHRIAKHAHVPMQSGSDRVLRGMHRKYRPWHYREKIEKIRSAMPTAAIGADVMVGFPGESDADFEETRGMIEDLPFTYLHVFTYSARPGTPAVHIANQVPVRTARDRNRVLRELAAAKKFAFMQSFVGKTVDAITLNVFNGGYTEALTDNYLKLKLAGRHEANQWIPTRVQDVEHGALVGEVMADVSA
ncbi:MAG: tRNA (N(6)-L-threonylcarbamoyladenosine(37)-C(2))-methylthiotransferase MtaB [Acidobacteria bacterium]|nr:MAG: tRNA (N(6)-L-threonylcarbamoyladenosine(37)-C(2))-methylthiotransferase MtaB [Acidobacteriota bacterium]